MPRNYDEMRAARDMEFVICGESFTMKVVGADIFGDWEEREEKADLTSNKEFIALARQRVRDVIDDSNGAVARWDAMQEKPDAPSFGELADLMRWILEIQSGIPTMPPAPSEVGRGKTAASSKAA